MQIKPFRPKTKTILQFPGDKSITHRAILHSALATGTSVIHNHSTAADCLRTAEAVMLMGAQVQILQDKVVITSAGANNLTSPGAVDCGNSGTTCRLLTGLLVGLGLSAKLTGDKSLSARPMQPLVEMLNTSGADIQSNNGCLPLKINSQQVSSTKIELPSASAQLKSAAIYALGLTNGGVVNRVGVSRDHTEQLLGLLCTGDSITVPQLEIPAQQYTVPGDISSAAFFIATAACIPGVQLVVRNVGLNPRRMAFIDVLRMMGADIQTTMHSHHIGDIVVKGSNLHGVQLDASFAAQVLDEYPALAIAAVGADSESIWHGLTPLRTKECDRAQAIYEIINALGGSAQLVGDTLTIKQTALSGGRIKDYNDHRIAMMSCLLSVHSAGSIEIENAAEVATSLPEFFELAAQFGLNEFEESLCKILSPLTDQVELAREL